MYERRRQAASLVSLLVVTSLFIWACSSSDHEGTTVTTSGGAGSRGTAGNPAWYESEAGSLSAAGGAPDTDPPTSVSEGGTKSVGDVPPSEQQPSVPGESESENGAGTTGNGGAGTTEELPRELGGYGGMITPEMGGAGSGTAASGASAFGGSAPVIVEAVCDPADDHSTPDMVLPCEVSTALYVCRNCHGNPPLKSTGTSYVTFADIKANAALIYGVIKAGTMPWPPYKMSVWEKSTALNWLGKNGSCAVGAHRGCQ